MGRGAAQTWKTSTNSLIPKPPAKATPKLTNWQFDPHQLEPLTCQVKELQAVAGEKEGAAGTTRLAHVLSTRGQRGT